MGNNVGISGVILYAVEEIVVEDFVNLGAGVRIYDNDHHPLKAQARRMHDESRIPTAPVRICQDAFIGAEALTLKGVTVGSRAVVAARAVVTRDVPTDAIVACGHAREVGHVDNGF
jgi:acetyltransferase-like isoleucine patch superfamily enzyme